MTSNALTGHSARPLPAGETLPLEDYRRLIGVIEAVDQATDLPMFRERLLRALQTWFGYSGVAVLHGRTLAAAVEEGCGIRGGYSAEFLAEYAEGGWSVIDPFRTERGRETLISAGVATLTEIAPDRDYLDRFLRPHGITDKAALVIDGGPAGVVFVSMAVGDGAPRISDRDLAALHRLRRHLAPLAIGLLNRDREQAAARADWRLTPREREVAGLAAQGLTNRQIADRLFIGIDTVKKHLTRALAETGATGRTHLSVLWRQHEPAAGP